MYFHPDNDENCFPIEEIKDMMRDDGVNELHVEKAIRDTGGGFYYCISYGDVGETSDGHCGSNCEKYIPRNGKSGICKSHRPTYVGGEKILIKLNNK